MNITVNGDPHELDEGTSVLELVKSVEPQRWERGVAVALNGEVLPSARWPDVDLAEADRVEVLAAIGGG